MSIPPNKLISFILPDTEDKSIHVWLLEAVSEGYSHLK